MAGARRPATRSSAPSGASAPAARVRISQPSEIALYVKAFEQLRGMAVYGAEARALILKAIEALH
ncbi:hypothetical protein IEJ02_42030 [Streptomyces sp. 5-10]|nr:hypothetical protein [Streptomyces sp. 5-10]